MPIRLKIAFSCMMTFLKIFRLCGAHDVLHGHAKGTEIIEIPEANKMIQSDIENAIRHGLLKKSRSHDVLMDIRHTRLIIQQARNRLVKEIRGNFEELIYRLKDREKVVLGELNQIFDQQVEFMNKEEERW